MVAKEPVGDARRSIWGWADGAFASPFVEVLFSCWVLWAFGNGTHGSRRDLVGGFAPTLNVVL